MPNRKNQAKWISSRNRWQINVQMAGIRRTFTSAKVGDKGKIEAERKADKWLEERTINENTKCEVLLDQFFTHVQVTTSKSNWRTMHSRIECHIKPQIGKKQINRLTTNDLQRVLDACYKKGMSKRAIKNVKADLMAFIKYCRCENVTRFFPEGLKIPAGARGSNKTIAEPKDICILFSSEKTSYCGKACTDWYIHAYRFMVLSGVRLGELLGLKWEDIVGNEIRIRRALNNENEFTEGKNERARRTISLRGLALEELEQQRLQQKAAGLSSQFVFSTPNGTPCFQGKFRRYWERYIKYNNIKKITPYELRHTYVSVNKEMPEGFKKLVVGHSQDMDTEGVYGHKMAGDLERAAEYSDRAFRNLIGK